MFTAPTRRPVRARRHAITLLLAAVTTVTAAGCGGSSPSVTAGSAPTRPATQSPTPPPPETSTGTSPAPPAAATPATSADTLSVPPPSDACALTVATATAILGAQAEDEGWGVPHCVFSPTTESGYGQPTYYSVGENTYPNQSVTTFRAAEQENGDTCPRHLDRPDLGTGAYEAYCLVDDFVGGGQKAMLVLPDAGGSWELVAEVHQARVNNESTAADLLHKAMTALRVG